MPTTRSRFPASLENSTFYLIGIKGTGMAALAEILADRRAAVSGSDTEEKFYTDAVLDRLGIFYHEGFDADHVDESSGVVVHSLAYTKDANPEIARAAALGLPVFTYPEALGELSRRCTFAGVAGTHGKTTTTAMAGSLVKSLGLPATVLVGSEVPAFGGRSTLSLGDDHLIAESCEYRRSFLLYEPDRIVVTNIEADHLDYYRDLADIIDAFRDFYELLPSGGALIYNADCPGVQALLGTSAGGGAAEVPGRPHIRAVPFGRRAAGAYRIESIETTAGETRFRLAGFTNTYRLRVPGEHSVYNAAAALALTCDIAEAEGMVKARGIGEGEGPADASGVQAALERKLADGLLAFSGTRRRSEVLGEAAGVLFMDDYAHHPTAVAATLRGLRRFYPRRRIVADFMSHTYSRTASFLNEFGEAFMPAHAVILHEIYASAREQGQESVSGRDLFRAVARSHPDVRYYEDPLDAVEDLESRLSAGDLFITMGAGSNWRLGRLLYERFSAKEHG